MNATAEAVETPKKNNPGLYVLLVLAVAAPLATARLCLYAPVWFVIPSGIVLAVVGTLVLKRGRILAPLAGGLAGVLTWLFAYGTVALDNPTNDDLTFVIDDGAKEIRVAAQHDTVERLPVGARTIEIMKDGKRLDSFTGNVTSNGDHLGTPQADACYGLNETVYGAYSGADEHGNESLKGKRWYTLEHVDYLFEDPPSSVTSDSSGKAVRSLHRVYCDTATGQSDES